MKKSNQPTVRNLVAKYSRQFCKATVVADKTKYNRRDKHKGSKEGYLFSFA